MTEKELVEICGSLRVVDTILKSSSRMHINGRAWVAIPVELSNKIGNWLDTYAGKLKELLPDTEVAIQRAEKCEDPAQPSADSKALQK